MVRKGVDGSQETSVALLLAYTRGGNWPKVVELYSQMEVGGHLQAGDTSSNAWHAHANLIHAHCQLRTPWEEVCRLLFMKDICERLTQSDTLAFTRGASIFPKP
jgi:hypothetical protein